MYAIKKNQYYVKDMRFGGHSSYTTDPSQARRFETLDEAKKNCCGNEHIIQLTYIHREEVMKKES